MIGLVLAAQFLPVPVLGAYGGLIADRVPKRPLLLGTQTAHTTLHGGADVFGFLTSAMGAGAVLGGLLVATFSVTVIAPLTAAAVGFGLAVLAAALVPTLATELVALVLVGAASTAFMATGNSTLQLTSAPSFRGRVMALWAVTFQGSTPIGGPIIGAVSEYASPRFGLALGALAFLLGAALGATALRRTPPGERSAPHPAQMDWITYQQAHNGP